MKRVLPLGIVVVLAFGATGCARLGRVAPFGRAPEVTAEQLATRLRERTRPVDTLWMRANIRAWRRGYPGQLRFDATILADPPDRLRLRLRYPNVSILVFEMLADNWGIRVADELNKRYFAGRYERWTQTSPLWAALAPASVLRGLLVEQTILDALNQAQSAEVKGHWRDIELRIEAPEARYRVFFDRAGERILAVNYEPRSGERSTRLEFGEMVEVQGVRLPKELEIAHGPSRARLQIEVLGNESGGFEYKVDTQFDPRAFVLEAPNRQWLPPESLDVEGLRRQVSKAM